MPSVLADRYELRTRIGSGGMATVWRTFDRRLGREVAVKVLSESLAAEETFRHRFEREARHIGSLAHPNIVVVHDFGTHGDQLFIVMELIRGKSLRQLLGESTPMPAPRVADLATEILAGLNHAHEAGILHRDIKPGNILITESGTSKLADFGIAQASDQTVDLTGTGAILGTVAYASPEQLSGRHLSPASDLYSLGCVLYECVVGHPPFVADNIAALVSQRQFASPEPLRVVAPEYPVALADSIMRALEKDPAARFVSAREMTEALGSSGDASSTDRAAGQRPRRRGPGAEATFAERLRGAPPTGTVTLLLTEVEGANRMWEEHPGTMPLAFNRHKEILEAAVAASGGYAFRSVGNQFSFAFPSATEALVAATSAQRAMAGEPWPGQARIQVRMSLHSGVCVEEAGDYFGPTVNRAARLLDTAHGGQIVLSTVSAELVRDVLPEGTALRDLGEHRMKDLGRPERIFQLCAEGLESEFPPLRSLDDSTLNHNLPVQLTSFVGRDDELAQVSRLLTTSRLVTVVGAGGSGKSRLAIQAAANVLDRSDQKVWLVELAAMTDPELVVAWVATALRVREEAGRSMLETLESVLREERLLLLLDNCEHLLDACARLAEAILRSCPGVTVLATSREALGVGGERVYRIPSLLFPATSETMKAEEVRNFDAMQLFVERAVEHQPSFSLNDTNCKAVASISRRLDGMPLAIELAAARLSSLSVADIDERLDNRFRLLTGGSRTALPRQQTLARVDRLVPRPAQ